MVALSLQTDLKDLQTQKEDMLKFLETLNKHKDIRMSVKDTIQKIERKITRLLDKITTNQLLDSKLSYQITNIFQAAVENLQLQKSEAT